MIYLPTLEDLSTLGLAILACGVLVGAFWVSYDWIDEVMNEKD